MARSAVAAKRHRVRRREPRRRIAASLFDERVPEEARVPPHGVAQGVRREPARRAPHAQGRLAASSSPTTAPTRAATTSATSTGTSTAGSTSCCSACSRKRKTSTSTSCRRLGLDGDRHAAAEAALRDAGRRGADLRRAREPRPRRDHPVRRPAASIACRRRAARTASSACSSSCATCEIGGKTELAECMKDFVTQNKRRGLAVVISDFYDPARLRAGHQHAPLPQVRAVRAPGLRPARGDAEAARRPRARRLRDRRHQRGHGLASRCSRRTSASTRSTARSSRRTARSTRCRSSARTPSIPFDELVLQDLPLGRLPAVSFLGPDRRSADRRTLGRDRRRASLAVSAYIIKMRRRRFEVPFSQLWQRVLEQKDANALWKQLKRLISLLLMLRDPRPRPVRRARSDARRGRSQGAQRRDPARRVGVDEGDGRRRRRQEVAHRRREGARRSDLIDSMGGGDVAMVMKVDGQATPMSRFSNDGADARQDHRRHRRERHAGRSAARARRRRRRAARPPEPADRASSPTARSPRRSSARSRGTPATATQEPRARSISSTSTSATCRSASAATTSASSRSTCAATSRTRPRTRCSSRSRTSARSRRTASSRSTTARPPSTPRRSTSRPGQRIRQIYAKLPGERGQPAARVAAPVDGPGGTDPFALDDTAYALLPARKKQKVLMVTDGQPVPRGRAARLRQHRPAQGHAGRVRGEARASPTAWTS